MNRTPVYLQFCEVNNNINKFYRMTPISDTRFLAEWGREGVGKAQSMEYDMRDWDKKYNEKVKKGYKNKSDQKQDLVVEVKKSKDYKPINNANIRAIVERLQSMTTSATQKNYNVAAAAVTQAMVDAAQAIIDKLATDTAKYSVDDFNALLIELFETIPRKMKKVIDYVAKSKDDFDSIITREQQTLDTMRSNVVQKHIETDNDSDDEPTQTILEVNGITVEEPTDDDIKHVKEMFGADADKIKNIWKVTNLASKKRFDDYVAAHKITEIVDLFHGSRNANWWPIMLTDLIIRPASAAANGSMLGRGNYMANDIRKSRTYTDRSDWTSKKESTGFVGIMECAYGKPYDINAFDNRYYSYDAAKLEADCPGANCLHAHRGMNTGWRNLSYDEIVFYSLGSTRIKYLVEFV